MTGKLTIDGLVFPNNEDSLYLTNKRGGYYPLRVLATQGDYQGVLFEHANGTGSGGPGPYGAYGFKFDDQRNNNYSSHTHAASFIVQRSGAYAQTDIFAVVNSSNQKSLAVQTGGLVTMATGLSSAGNITATTLTLNAAVADYAASMTNVLDDAQGLLVRATDNDPSLYLLRLQSSNAATGQTWVDRFTVTKNGAATFSSDLTISGNTSFGGYIVSDASFADGYKLMVRQPSMSIDALKGSYFGYSSGYGILLVGHPGLNNRSIAFGVDVTGNPSGAFSGLGSEYVWKNVGQFITPNSINNGYNTLFGWNSAGGLTFNQASEFIGTLTSGSPFSIKGTTPYIQWINASSSRLGYIQHNASNLVFSADVGVLQFTSASTFTSSVQIGDYSGSPTLTMAASANGINKINFYDSNNTEGLYLRTDGELYGGTMTFGARWDDDEAKIVFKMYQVSAGGTYHARVGIGTTGPSSTLHVIGDNGTSANAVLRLRDTNSTSRTTRLQFEDYAGAYADGLIDFKIPTAGSATGARLDLGVGGAIISLVNGGNVGIGTTSPNALLNVKGSGNYNGIIAIDNGTTTGGGALFIRQNGANSGFVGVLGGALGTSDRDFCYYAEVGLGHVFFTNDGTRVMTMTSGGNVGIGTTSIPGKFTAKYSSYSSAQTPLYVGNTGFTAWNRQSYDTFVLQQDDVTSFRMVEKNGEATTSDQVLTFSIGDGVGRIATSGQPLQFYVNGSPSGLAYQGLSGTQVLAMNTNGSAQFNYAVAMSSTLDVTSTVSTGGNFVASNSGIAEIRLRGGGYGASYNTSLRSIAGAPGVLQMGNNGPNYILAGNTLGGGLLYFRVNCASESTTAGSLCLTLNANATAQFESTVTASGDIVAYSDRRIKENIKPIENALSKTLSLQGVTYNRIETEADKSTKIGFIAQDVLDVLPEVVTHNLDSDIYGVSYGNVTALLVEAIKELKAEVNDLKSRLDR
jgi:hypothetical protein